jgi:uncharacterized membrane protein YeaQ/YmgE (transglycosylase-associated protein family)
MSVILMMVLGAAAGWLATRAMGMRLDPVSTLALGSLGALVGVMGLRLALTVVNWAVTLAAAVLGALLVVWLWRVLVEGR